MDYRSKFSAYASRPDAQWLLFCVALMEGAFVPIPSDFLLIPMALLAPESSFRYAFVAGVGSVAGAFLGYLSGWFIYVALGGYLSQYAWIEGFLQICRSYSGVFLVSAGFSSVPFNVVTFLSGMAHVNILLFVAVMLIVRILRFTTISWLIWRGGARYQEWLERNFYGTMLVMTLALLVVSAIGILFFETA